MPSLLKVLLPGGKTGLVNMEKATSLIYDPDPVYPINSKVHLQFDSNNTITLIGEEAQRVWSLFTEGKEWKVY
jgi:hypothetical protein